MQKGTIKRLVADRGFGFIKTEREEELFFGRNQLQGVDYGSLREGQKVEFEVTRDPNGHLHAIRVTLAQPKENSSKSSQRIRREHGNEVA